MELGMPMQHFPTFGNFMMDEAGFRRILLRATFMPIGNEPRNSWLMSRLSRSQPALAGENTRIGDSSQAPESSFIRQKTR